MSKLLSHKFGGEYSVQEWTIVKISVVIFWLRIVHSCITNTNGIPYPTGIFSMVDGSFLVSNPAAIIFLILAFVLAVLYITEKWMVATTFLMFSLSLVLFTLEESNGILNRNSLYTMIFFVQAIAYYRNNIHLHEERIQFPIQIIAAGYMLAGFSKLNNSGLSWITDSPLVSIQVLKGYCYAYFNTGDVKQLQHGLNHAHFILAHKWFVKSVFAGSLLLELFAWLAVKNKRTAFIYGILLFTMHMGIFYFMNILIGAVFYPMLFFMINPLYFLYLPFSKLFTRLKANAPVNIPFA